MSAMDVKALQTTLGVAADGAFGPKSRAALLAAFTNMRAPAATEDDIAAIATMLGCSVKQVRAVAKVESAGSGFDTVGRPKMLYERHLFHRLTNGKWSTASFSNGVPGGYSDDSWAKLGDACAHDPEAAFSACSWGKFQVLGTHWSKLGYDSPFELAHTCVSNELAHYTLLARYVRTFGLTGAIRRLSTDPADCRDFASGYNGPGYKRFSYDKKLAEAMG